jgi:hypothetical protein
VKVKVESPTARLDQKVRRQQAKEKPSRLRRRSERLCAQEPRSTCLRCAGSSCGYVAVDAVVRLKVIVKLSGDLLEISLKRLLSIGGGYADAWNCPAGGCDGLALTSGGHHDSLSDLSCFSFQGSYDVWVRTEVQA